ncbi:Rz1-like lysis system protein LysC [Xanthomonas albilineans]|uniref:Rz1-like lysis system protein LysC n=1 Tax=Xanthomonas albilineans TaxID=29447 RepID=UPI0009BB47FF
MSRYPAALIALLALAGCAQVRPAIPAKVYVPVSVPAQLPASLTKPCPAVRVKTRTVDALVAAYNADVSALDDCDARMSQIRKLSVPEQKP